MPIDPINRKPGLSTSIVPKFARPRRLWTQAKCHIAIYLAAVYCDGEEQPQETVAVAALISRSPTLHDLSAEAIEGYINELQPAFFQGQTDDLMEEALKNLPPRLEEALAIYANCVDIVLADRQLKAEEHRFLSRLAQCFRLPADKRARIDRVIFAKNQMSHELNG